MKFHIVKAKVLALCTAMLFTAFLFGSAIAQQGTATVHGNVYDKNGAAVPGATVRLTNPDTGFLRTATTGTEGEYSFPGIQPATYKMEVEAPNFKKLVNTNVKALVDSPLELNPILEAGDVSVVVDVTSNTIESVINTQDASLGNNFEPQQIQNLPTDLRRVADLLTLQPGVTREGYVAGGRSDQANVLLDGVDINDQQNGGRTEQFQTSQDTVLRATAESVEEFRITTTNANANQGRSSGAQISLITKSGTNDFRGSLFYFYRPTAFSANNFFNNLAGAERPSIARDVFGGAIGGPIKKDKFFFFYTYEGQRQQEGVSVVRTVPLAHMGAGEIHFLGTVPGETMCDDEGGPPGCTQAHPVVVNLAQLNNQIYPQAGINPAVLTLFQGVASRYPANDFSTGFGDGVNTGGFRFNSPTTSEENTHIVRLDYKLTDSMALYARGNLQNDILSGTSQFPDTPSTSLWDHPWGFVVGHDWAISANKVNNFRYGLTRQAFSTQGDSGDTSVTFRFVYEPRAYVRTLSRITPTQNITDDFTWIKGKHSFQLGGNVRIIRNQRVDFGNAFDDATTNPSWYNASGAVVTDAFFDAGWGIDPGDINTVQSAATALIGRLNQYTGSFSFDQNGDVLPAGSPALRTFATEEYDFYFQDSWKPFRNLTLTMGLRYGISRPVYEKDGFQVVPTEPMGRFFERRVNSSNQGVPLNDLITFVKGGPANNGPGFYKLDTNNWQPRLAAAWSPNFKSGWLHKLFGDRDESVIRGGFGITNDHFGGQLAVSFDQLSLVGFTAPTTISANFYNVTSHLAPRFVDFNPDVRSFEGLPAPQQRFDIPTSPECLAGLETCPQRIETGLDATIQSPTHYTWNVSFGRKLPGGMYFEASYIGRKARHLLASRDVMALNNIRDPQSNMDWYTAAGILHDLRADDVPFDSSFNLPYFDNLFGPGMPARVRQWVNDNFDFDDPTFDSLTPTQTVRYLIGHDGYDILDWTFIQSIIDDAGPTPNMFFHPQFGAYSSFGSIARSDYNGATFSLRQRLGEMLSYDINYTWAKSFDDASGLQSGTSYGSQFILNPLRQEDNYAYSDFDVRHSVNANFIFQLPFGKGRHYYNDMGGVAEVFLGGWQLSGIFRYNSGLPLTVPFDAAQWATNWNAQSAGTRIRPISININRNTQNAFTDPQAAFNSFRNARPGETGERNALRLSPYSTLDMGLSKTFNMPWSEGHKLQFRWEVFNVGNLQYFDVTGDDLSRSSYGLPQDPETGSASGDFGKIFSSIQGSPRRMQFGLRYSF